MRDKWLLRRRPKYAEYSTWVFPLFMITIRRQPLSVGNSTVNLFSPFELLLSLRDGLNLFEDKVV